MSQEPNPSPNPPKIVTLTVYLLFAAGLFQIIYSFTGATASLGRFYPASQVILIIIAFAALSGVLQMEKWGVWLFLTILVVKVLIDFWLGAVHPSSLLLLLPAAIFIRNLLMAKKD